jgi:hypothetical protein
MNLAQKLGLAVGILGFVGGASTQLTDIFAPFGSIAPVIVKEIVTVSGFVSGILGIFVTFVTGQSGIIKSVQEMPGVEKIIVNKQANQTLASFAVDPNQPKIETVAADKKAVQSTANSTP